MPDYFEKDIPWRSERDKIKKVIIEKGVTRIGKCAFYECPSLTSVTIPNSVTSLGAYAFAYCYKLATITIPNSVTSIGIRTFAGCSNLTSITIPNSVTDIGNYSFESCSHLVSITIPNSVTSIGSDAFYGCKNLNKICNSSSLTFSKGSSPYGHIYANFIYNNASVEGNYIFYRDNNANCYVCGYIGTDKNISLPIDIAGIADYAFYGCSGLVSVAIPNSVTSIGSFAFSGCSGLASVTIPNNVTNIGENAFTQCENLSELVYNAKNAKISASTTNLYFPASIKTVTIGKEVESIPSYFLYNNKNVTSITIPNSVTNIGENAFAQCENLSELVYNAKNAKLSASTTNLPFPASIKTVTIGKEVESIPSYFLYNNKNVTSITIPNSVTNIGENAFAQCENLSELVYNAKNAKLSASTTNLPFPASIKTVTIGKEVESIPQYFLYNNKNVTSITIPNSVTSIGYGAFSGCRGISSIIIPNSITGIGDNVFSGCSYLTSVTIPNSVTNIGGSAFEDCKSLTSISIPNSVTSIGGGAFSGCSGLTSVTIPNSVTMIGSFAFNSCSNLTSIAIPNSVTTIGNSAFAGCKNLTSIVIPNSMTSIEEAVFQNCSSLTSISIPNSVMSIGGSAFSGCSGLTSVTIPNSVTWIGQDAFSGCYNLVNLEYNAKNAMVSSRFPTSIKTVTIGNEVESIPSSFLYDNHNVTSVTIPNSVTSIGEYAFYGCMGLKKIFNNSSLLLSKGYTSNGYIAYYANAIYNNVSVEGDYKLCRDNNGDRYVCGYLGSEKNISLPINIVGIADYALDDCSGLTSITIPNSVKNIRDYAFYGCKLQTLIIGSDVTNIGNYIFSYGSEPTKTIWLPNTPPSGYINAWGHINYVSNENYIVSDMKVYKHLSSMFEVDGVRFVPVSPSERTCDAIDCNYDKNTENIKIGEVVSYKNIGMKVLNVNPYTCYDNEFIKTLNINNSGKIDNRAFEGCKNITSVSLGNKVTEIGDYAFSGCTGIKEIKITNLVTSIGNYSFNGCDLLKKVVFVDCPATIGTNAFENCSALAELNLGKKIKAIGNYAFKNCSSLTKISIPKTTASIGIFAFSGCKSLADVTIEDRTESISLGSNGSSPLFADCPINSVYLGGKLSYNTSSKSGYSPFYRNKDLQSVVIADTEEQIYDNEFYGCTNLKSVKIGDGVKSIGNWAFSGCANLESFSFGKSMQSIGKEAFSDCTKMTSITSYAAKAPECGSQALDDIDKWSCVLSVPYSCLASYQNADQWKEFFFIQEAEIDDKLVAAKTAFDKYKSEQKTIIEALAKEDDSNAVKAIINKAISDINSMEYDVKISLDENKAKILSFVTSIDEAVQKQRAEDQKTNGIEELEFAEKANIYDLNGRKITSSMFKSGLYIKNGKKVVVK